MWFKREKNQNRRLRRNHVLDVKLRSDQVRSARVRMVSVGFAVIFGTVFGLYLLWRTGEAALDVFVYRNPDFAVQQVDAQTDGVIALEQLRRWSGVKPGMNLIGLDLAAVKRNLEMVSVIETVSVERVLPHTLKIRVTERDPIAQVNVPHADASGAISLSVFQLDADGFVILPLDLRARSAPLGQTGTTLPVIAGMNLLDVRPGKKMESPPVQAALKLIAAFDRSPMAGLVDLRRLDVSAPGVLVVTTGQGNEVTFAQDNLEQQLRRWRGIYNYASEKNSMIVSADLAVANNVPVRLASAAGAPAAVPKVKPPKNRRRNV